MGEESGREEEEDRARARTWARSRKREAEQEKRGEMGPALSLHGIACNKSLGAKKWRAVKWRIICRIY